MKKFEEELSLIATSRETKGVESETLKMIDELLPMLVKEKEWKSVAKLHWEAHLVWQHTVMNEISKPENERDEKAIKLGAKKMLGFATKAKDVIEKHNFKDMIGGAYRFLGRAATYAEDHAEAKKYYETAISKYSGKNLKSKLEVSGFLADALIRLGRPEEGMELAKNTYDDFHKSKIGEDLKKEDYFAWAVWMSGIAPRVCNALIETDSEFDAKEMKKWLKETETVLKSPTGEIKWGDHNFQFRMDEINSVLSKLVVAVVLSLVLVSPHVF